MTQDKGNASADGFGKLSRGLAALSRLNGGSPAQLRLAWFLAKADLQKRFAGTIGGAVWAGIGPILMIGVVWFALDIGLGLRVSIGPDYGLRLVVALVAWQMVSETITDGATSISRNPHLVTKIVFPVGLLPVASALAATIVHCALVVAVMLMLAIMGQLSWSTVWLLPLAFGYLFILVSVIAVICATLNVVARDTGAIVPFFIAAAFWLTPIVWTIDRLPTEWRAIAFLNPFSLAIDGYRAALLGSPLPFGFGTAAVGLGITACLGGTALYVFHLFRGDFADRL
jgi:ABC-type polysaccharide/polyol phosphate export permease